MRKSLKKFEFNAAYYKLIGNWRNDEVIEYLNSFEIFGTEMCNNIVRMLNSPIYGLTNFAHQIGRDLIISRFGEYPSTRDFRYMLENPVVPSDFV